MTALVERARGFAARAHAAQRRKYTDEPYFVHLEEVAQLVAATGASDAVVAAAYLHDVVEDTLIGLGQLHAEFGADVARLVWEVTDVSRPADGNRAARKALDRAHLARASADGQTIKLADLISNTRSITVHDPRFAVVYLREKAELLTVLGRGNAALMTRAQELMP